MEISNDTKMVYKPYTEKKQGSLVVTRSWEKYYFEHSLSNVKIRKNELIVFYEN